MSVGESFEELVRVMHTLRRECPWDRVQTYETLRTYLLEETYEVLHALDERDYQELREELGDLLLQIVFQAEIAREGGLFDVGDVVRLITEKLRRRHPHVFAEVSAETPDEVVRRWERIKTDVEQKPSVLDGVPRELPGLLKATRILEKLRQTGIDVLPPGGALELAREYIGGAGAGDGTENAAAMLCLAAAALARDRDVNPEDALRRALGRLRSAFREEEQALRQEGRRLQDLSPQERVRLAERLRTAVRKGDQ